MRRPPVLYIDSFVVGETGIGVDVEDVEDTDPTEEEGDDTMDTS